MGGKIMSKKLVITENGAEYVDFTPEELAQREMERLAQEEQALIDSLKPSVDDIQKAEFELNTINLLTDLGVL